MAVPDTVAQVPKYVISHPANVFGSLSTVAAFCALSPTPSFIGIVALLATLRLSAWTFVPRRGGYVKGAVQAGFISLAAGAAHLAPSSQALSTPNVALVILSAISFIASSIAVAVVFGSVKISRSLGSWSQLTVFPAVWATAWGCTSKVSPVGQLVTWSPVLGLGPYAWIRPYLGQWGVDWLAAAWAVILSEVLGDWLAGASGKEEHFLVDVEPPLIDHDEIPHHMPVDHSIAKTSSLSRSVSLWHLLAILLILMVPIYFIHDLPIPLNASTTTPFGIACALPNPYKSKLGGRNPTLQDYISETKTLQNQASVIFWPESAVRFENPDDRIDAFVKVQAAMVNKTYVGISFEDYVFGQIRGQSGVRRNGFVLLGKSGPPILEYYKRNLVPIAESFSLTPGKLSPEIIHLPLDAPKGIKKPDWAPGPNFTRPIPITASICLDYATSSSFTSLESRPGLILAPARTWHIGVGLAMWEQAKARAAETGSTVVWCDGGKGGISGIATGAHSEIVQVGPGSWVKQVGIEYPFDEHGTFYTWGGDMAAFLIVWAGAGAGSAVQFGAKRISFAAIKTAFGRVFARIMRGRSRNSPAEESSLLQ